MVVLVPNEIPERVISQEGLKTTRALPLEVAPLSNIEGGVHICDQIEERSAVFHNIINGIKRIEYFIDAWGGGGGG